MGSKKHYDAEDLKAVLGKTDTADGPGTENLDELPESDFVSFAADDVEKESDK